MASGDGAREVDRDRNDVKARKIARDKKLREIRNKTVLDTNLTPEQLLENERQRRAEFYAREEQRRMARAFMGEIAASFLLVALAVATFGWAIPSVGGF